jgi:hypothetical protein
MLALDAYCPKYAPAMNAACPVRSRISIRFPQHHRLGRRPAAYGVYGTRKVCLAFVTAPDAESWR